MNSNLEIKLAAPGAGLPNVELIVARLLLRLRLWTGSRRSFRAKFDQERDKILHLYQSCDLQTAQARILIRRVSGLEDSSRNWSVWMTLDHLRIINRSITEIIGQLDKGVIPSRVASTAAVKPSVNLNAGVVTEYENSCDALLNAAEAASDLKKTVRYAHPWFGLMSAFGWYGLAGVHMGIHRVQVERILQGVPTHREKELV